jgi:LAO/AO transport system kinase
MDAFGKDVIITETVGVGQCELDIAEACYTTVVVLVPESGDAVQAMKAGLMEIADVLAVNKSDRDGADRMARQVRAVLELAGERNGWRPPVVCTTASEGEGIEELYEHINKHHEFLSESGGLERHRRKNVEATLKALVESDLHRRMWTAVSRDRLRALVGEVYEGRKTPRQASGEILKLLEGR